MIKYSIRGENIEVTDSIRNYVESKLGKIEKYFYAEQTLDARVNLKVYREKTAKVEVTILVDSIMLRAEDVSQDMYGSIDLVTDKIERQIRKNKTKIAKKHRENCQQVIFSQANLKLKLSKKNQQQKWFVQNMLAWSLWILMKRFFKWTF